MRIIDDNRYSDNDGNNIDNDGYDKDDDIDNGDNGKDNEDEKESNKKTKIRLAGCMPVAIFASALMTGLLVIYQSKECCLRCLVYHFFTHVSCKKEQ